MEKPLHIKSHLPLIRVVDELQLSGNEMRCKEQSMHAETTYLFDWNLFFIQDFSPFNIALRN